MKQEEVWLIASCHITMVKHTILNLKKILFFKMGLPHDYWDKIMDEKSADNYN